MKLRLPPVYIVFFFSGLLCACSFATDLDTGGIDDLQCSSNDDCPMGWVCESNGYCGKTAPDVMNDGLNDLDTADTADDADGDVDADGDSSSCNAPMVLCGEECVSLTSNDHCGECFAACAPGATCRNGACRCQNPTGDVCFDPSEGASVAICQQQVCNLTCETNRDDCNMETADGCETDLLTDEAHCGMCNQPCMPNENCCDGACTPDSCP